MTDPRTGVGSSLRRAREVRGVTLDEAARDTRLRVDQLDALEREDFDVLPGEVYVRASLRTYANYLGLDPDELSGAYARGPDDVGSVPPPTKMGPVERAIAASRIRDNQRFLLIVAVSILLILVAFGLLARGAAAPEPATIPAVTPSPAPDDFTIRAVLVASGEVGVDAEADGVVTSFTLRPGETRTLLALERLRFTVEDAGLVDVSLNGKDVTEEVDGSSHTYAFRLGDGGDPSSTG